MNTYTLPRDAYELLVEAFDGDERQATLVARAVERALQAFIDGARASRERDGGGGCWRKGRVARRFSPGSPPGFYISPPAECLPLAWPSFMIRRQTTLPSQAV